MVTFSARLSTRSASPAPGGRNGLLPARLAALLLSLAPAAAVITTATTATTAVAAAPATPAWTALGSAGPPALRDPAMAYDADTRSLVLFGGTTADGSPSAATWIFDGTGWTRAATLSGPVARSGSSMAFDGPAHQLVLFGGTDASNTFLSDAWAWNGAQWSPLPASSAGPPARTGASLAADPAGHLVLFGGTGTAAASPGGSTPSGAPVTLGDTWTWDGRVWTAQTATGGPQARTAAALADSADHSATVLFGGATDIAGTTLLGDTWTWTGTAWQSQAPPSSPPARMSAVLAGDSAVGRTLLVGGSSGGQALADTWAWDGSNWAQPVTSGSPGARSRAAGAYDAAATLLLVVGGAPTSSTQLLSTAPPGPTPPTTATGAEPPPRVISPVTSPTAPRTSPSPPVTTGPSTPAGSAATVAPPPPSVPTMRPTAPTGGPGGNAPAMVVAPGARVVITGSGFQPGSTVIITFHSATPQIVGRATVDSSGRVTATVTVPRTAVAGSHDFVMSGASPSGAPTSQDTAVLVSLAHPPAGTSAQTPVLVAISVALPVGTWVVTGLRGRRRSSRPSSDV